MHGQVRAQELPVYGAKTLAVRHGTLELHGRHGNMVHLEFKEIVVTPTNLMGTIYVENYKNRVTCSL